MAGTTSTAPKTEAEAIALREQSDAFFARQAEERAAQQREYLAPLRALVDSPEFRHVEEQARILTPAYATTDALDVHLRPLAGFLVRLRGAVDAATPVDSPALGETPPPTA